MVEGVDTRKTGRLSGVHPETVAFSPTTNEVQFDETWAFVGRREKHYEPDDAPRLLGSHGDRPREPDGRQRGGRQTGGRVRGGRGPGRSPTNRRSGDAADHIGRVPGLPRSDPSSLRPGDGAAPAPADRADRAGPVPWPSLAVSFISGMQADKIIHFKADGQCRDRNDRRCQERYECGPLLGCQCSELGE